MSYYEDLFEKYRKEYINKHIYVIDSPGIIEEVIFLNISLGRNWDFEITYRNKKDNEIHKHVLGRRAFFTLKEATVGLKRYVDQRNKVPESKRDYIYEVPTIVCQACDKPISPLGRCGCN